MEMVKIAEFSKISIKVKNFKTFYEVQKRAALRKLFNPSHQIKASYVLACSKDFLTEIYRNIQTFAFQAFSECSSWASGNVAVQMFFCQGCFLGNSLLCHSPKHPKLFWPCYSLNLVGAPELYRKMSDPFC